MGEINYTTNEDFEGVSIRHVLQEDEAFLLELYISGRSDLDMVISPDGRLKDILFWQQFQSEKEFFNREYSDADYNIVLFHGKPVGRLYVCRGARNFRILAITLLPEYRSKGIGRYLIGCILKDASLEGKPVRLQVAWYNYSARSLYERIGFCVVEDVGVYCEMQWTPNPLGFS